MAYAWVNIQACVSLGMFLWTAKIIHLQSSDPLSEVVI